MYRFLILGVALVALAGCISASKTVLPDGRQGQIVSCPGLANSLADCWAKAGQICPKGYEIVGTDAEATPAAMISGNMMMAGSVMHRSIMVTCKS